MAQQSTTEPREAVKTRGKLTREHTRRVINKQERTDSPDIDMPGESLDEGERRHPRPAPDAAYDLSTGDRAQQRGINDRGPHDKQR